MDGGAEHIPVLEHHRAEVAADPDRDRLTIDLELGVRGNLLLHLGSGVEGIVGTRERRHDLVTHGLDDGPVPLFGRASHHIDANSHHIACAQIPHELVEPGGTDDVGEQNGEFNILAHVLQANGRPGRGTPQA